MTARKPGPTASYSAQHTWIASALGIEFKAYLTNLSERKKRAEERAATKSVAKGGVEPVNFTQGLRIKVTILMAAYVEALANFYLAVKLNAEQFEGVDRLEIMKKWIVMPSLLSPGYALPRGGCLYGDLKFLIDQRNAIVHMKPRVIVREKLVHKGHLPEALWNELPVLNLAALPRGLIENVLRADKSDEAGTFGRLSGLKYYEDAIRDDPAIAHVFGKAGLFTNRYWASRNDRV